MFDKLKKLFQRRTVPMPNASSKLTPPDLGDALRAPGAGFQPSKAITLPEPSVVAATTHPVIVPAVVVPQPIVPKPVIAVKANPGVCHACGQRLPEPVAPVVDRSVLTAEWNELERVDLEPRTSAQIQLLIAAGETPDNREKRIWNDKLRYAHYQSR
jgi:hypothetical protein